MILISTIICTYNRADVLKICLNKITLQEADPATFEVIIIDNNSNDHTADIVKTFISNYTGKITFHYFLEKKQGLSTARNRGYKEAKGEYINFIDDDAMIPSDYLNQLILCIQSNSDYDGFGGKITPHYLGSEPSWMSFFTWGLVSKHDLGPLRQPYKTIGNYPTGCNMTYKKSALEDVGGFDEKLLRRCDDKYIAYKIKKRGKKILYCPEVQLDHLIDEDRLTNRLSVICKDTGWHERVRLRDTGFLIRTLKLLEYSFKLLASLIIGIYYTTRFEIEKATMVIKMRWWFLVGYIFKK